MAMDISSRQFVFASQKWRILLTKRDSSHLSPYVEWVGRSAQTIINVDFTFTLLNADSYTQNETFASKMCQFDDGETGLRHL